MQRLLPRLKLMGCYINCYGNLLGIDCGLVVHSLSEGLDTQLFY